MEPILSNLLALPQWPDMQMPSPSPGVAPAGGTDSPFSAVEAPGAGSGVPAFGEVLSRFLDQVNTTQGRADTMVESLALGEPVDVHQVMLSLNEASAALQMTLQVRGKLLDAYQELMRTQI